VIGSSMLVCKKRRAIERRVVAVGGERKNERICG
jgi:ABC-type xylose transport system permease subunit